MVVIGVLAITVAGVWFGTWMNDVAFEKAEHAETYEVRQAGG